MKILTEPSQSYPIWIAIRGDKFVVAQDQEHAAQSFTKYYGNFPEVVINGLYFTRPVNALTPGRE